MAVSFIGANTAEATTVTIPTHQAGDLIIIAAFRGASTTHPTVPTGWRRSAVRAGSSMCLLLSVKTAQSGSETSGTWTNAELLLSAVYRDDANYLDIGGLNTTAAISSTAINYAALVASASATTSSAFLRTSSACVIGLAGIVSNTGDGQTAPTGMTNRANITGVAARKLTLHDTASAVSSWSSTTYTASVAANWSSVTVELMDTGIPKNSGVGSLINSQSLVRGIVI